MHKYTENKEGCSIDLMYHLFVSPKAMAIIFSQMFDPN